MWDFACDDELSAEVEQFASAVIGAVAAAAVLLAKPVYRLLRGRAVFVMDVHSQVVEELRTDLGRVRERLDDAVAREQRCQERLLDAERRIGTLEGRFGADSAGPVVGDP